MAHTITPRPHQTGKHKESKSTAVQKMSSDGSSQIGVIGSLALSVTSSVAIVICNKYLISSLGFLFATTLTSWHLLVTFLTLHVAQRLHFFEPKPIDAQTNILFGLLNGTCIGLLNLCLGFNSVGFYQMTKLAIIPFTVLLETIFLNKRFSQSIKMSLMVLLLGVGIASVTDLQLNFLGSIIAALALVTTCVSQILTNTIQKKLKVSSTQLLYQSSPYQSAILFVTGPFVDKMLTHRSVFAFNYNVQVLVFITLSCLIAVSVNFSTFLVIGTTSPVTYQVLGHLKTCLILSFGFVLLKDPFTARNILGILIAIFGMGLYSYFSVQESRNKKLESKDSLNSNDSLPISQATDKEGTPLLSSKLAGLDEENGNLPDEEKNSKNAF
ncbi:Nucleotide/sugar transporter family protein [Rhynchospora pubera]|uniref:Nucleotide/sugar transporter family protein n=2 Tax=Rhynchospora pubera TaxID=906938 RepID=A0AAV8E822_9POAL|nr:Nucleotide/sugar transporter family protein [Rhynchospora pubera]